MTWRNFYLMILKRDYSLKVSRSGFSRDYKKLAYQK